MASHRSWRWILALAAIFWIVGCDGKDPDRLNRVGKKIAQKGRKFSAESKLPKVNVEWPENTTTHKN